jgi:putative restriction endonuclease
VAKGVFLHRADSIYDDRPEVQYQFPKQYLGRAAPSEGDWILYYEPRKGGGRGYYAMAFVERIVPDPSAPGMYLALIQPGSYLPFERTVPFSGPRGVVERGLLNEAGVLSGRAQAAVRPISLDDFNRILELGFPEEEPLLPRTDTPVDAPTPERWRDVPQSPFVLDVERDRVSYLSSRIIRDRVFRKIVLDAYDCRCAITGLKLINGGGRAEVQAAHIKPVEASGPDIITNGIALSGTAHWMFDRGLISLSNELEVLVSRQVNDADSVWGLVNRTRQAVVPASPALRPHPSYLAWHREVCFKR